MLFLGLGLLCLNLFLYLLYLPFPPSQLLFGLMNKLGVCFSRSNPFSPLLPIQCRLDVLLLCFPGVFPHSSVIKNLPAMQEIRVQFLGWEDPLAKVLATHSSILPWRVPWDRGVWRATVHGVTKSQTGLKLLSMHACIMCFPSSLQNRDLTQHHVFHLLI